MITLANSPSPVSLTKAHGIRKTACLPGGRSLVKRVSCSAKPTKVDEGVRAPKDALQSLTLGGSALMAPYLMLTGEAMAKGGEFGLLEGRTLALIHPAVMAFLFGMSCYAGYLGWQWRSLREIGSDIRDLKKELPPVGEDGVRPASPLDGEISFLEEVMNVLKSHVNVMSCSIASGGLHRVMMDPKH